MTKAQPASPEALMEPISLTRVLRAIRTYLTERFPIFTQGGTVLSAYVCCYLLYGRAHGHQVFGWATIVGGISTVLLTLVRRIIDDIEDLRKDILTGRIASADGGRRHWRSLAIGAVAVTALVGALNVTCSVGLLAISIGIAAWFPLATLLKHTRAAQSSGILFYIINETCPIVGLVYPYAIWQEVSGHRLPAIAVLATIGLFWTTWEFWMFTRKVGVEGWPPWQLTMTGTRNALIVFLAVEAAFSALIDRYDSLPVGYMFYGLGLSVVFAAIILRWWSRLPDLEPNRVRALWSGLPFAVAVEAGALAAVLVASL
jgi:hypothetical protein